MKFENIWRNNLTDVTLDWFLNFWKAILTVFSKQSHSLTNLLSHRMFRKLTAFSLNLSNFWGINLSADIISSPSTRAILQDLEVLSIRNGLILV